VTLGSRPPPMELATNMRRGSQSSSTFSGGKESRVSHTPGIHDVRFRQKNVVCPKEWLTRLSFSLEECLRRLRTPKLFVAKAKQLDGFVHRCVLSDCAHLIEYMFRVKTMCWG